MTMTEHDTAAQMLIAESCIYQEDKISGEKYAAAFVEIPALNELFEAIKSASVYRLQQLTKAHNGTALDKLDVDGLDGVQISVLLSECQRPISIPTACYTARIDPKELARMRDNISRHLASVMELTEKQRDWQRLLKAITTARAQGLGIILHNSYVAATEKRDVMELADQLAYFSNMAELVYRLVVTDYDGL
jgi:hypothetical protein